MRLAIIALALAACTANNLAARLDGGADLSGGDLAPPAVMLDSGADRSSDGGVDLSGGDLAPSSVGTSAIWIASGGSAASVTQQVGIIVGGTDTVGTVTAASGAQLTCGMLAGQTE